MANYLGIDKLRKRLKQKQVRIRKRYSYYEMKSRAKDFEISTPEKLQSFMFVLGWCGKAVDSIADRLMFREFEEDNFNINEIFRMNNPDTFFDSAILSALIESCSFIYIQPTEDVPKLQVVKGKHATGVVDSATGLLTEGYAILEFDRNDNPIIEAYFTPGKVEFYQNGKRIREEYNSAPYPLLVPVINRPDASRTFGHSRISRACMDITDGAIRTIKRSEISAEFFSFPQKYVVGTSPESDPLDKWKSAMSYMIEITKDDEGDSPSFGQFQQQSMSPHLDQLKMFAGLFAGETGLTVEDLGFPSDNPSSAEAIKSSHENLRLIARKAQRNFGTAFLNVGYLAACVRDDFAYNRSVFYLTRPTWEPIFEPDAAALSSYGDGAIKINQAIPGYFDEKRMRDLTGF